MKSFAKVVAVAHLALFGLVLVAGLIFDIYQYQRVPFSDVLLTPLVFTLAACPIAVLILRFYGKPSTQRRRIALIATVVYLIASVASVAASATFQEFEPRNNPIFRFSVYFVLVTPALVVYLIALLRADRRFDSGT